jgi:murein DD-endopeptidase MepM/ murein hydrolase activator NlpD
VKRRKQPSNWLGRAITGLIIGLGMGAVALSFVPAAPASVSPGPLPHGEIPDLTQPSIPAHAARASDAALRSGTGGDVASAADPLEEKPTPSPIIRDAAPTGALPALANARGIITGEVAAQAVAAPPAPFSVVVALDDPASLGALGQAIVSGLSQQGVSAALASLADAGRPDVILALNGVSSPRNEVWFCDPGPEQSAVLATELLDAVGTGSESTPAADAPQSNFPCEDIHAGRARVPAVLLELADGGAAADPSLIVQALRGYFDTHRGPVLAARAAPRLIWPAIGAITSHYNASHPLGIDIGQWTGPILAATDGVVTFAGGDACCSYGIYVILQGSDGIGTLYGHLSSLAVAEGEHVKQGQVLGQVGCTGTCTGPHLHFEVWLNGVRQNPMEYLN